MLLAFYWAPDKEKPWIRQQLQGLFSANWRIMILSGGLYKSEAPPSVNLRITNIFFGQILLISFYCQ
jgi:hypothetical protein